MLPLRVLKRGEQDPTRDILGLAYRQDPRDDPPLPPAIKNTSDLTLERAKTALQYADERIRSTRRKVTPITGKLLHLYKEAALQVIFVFRGKEQAEPDDNMESAAMMRAMESEFRYAQHHPARNDEIEELKNRLLSLKKYEFFARYGDYLATFSQRLKTRSQVEKTVNHELLQGRYWTDLHRAIVQEGDAWKQWCAYSYYREQNHENVVKTHFAINEASRLIGLAPHEARDLIEQYAARNDLFHNSVDALIQRGKLYTLGDMLARDLKELPLIIPAEHGHLQSLYQTLITTLIDEHFDRTGHEDNPEGWNHRLVSDRLYEEYKAESDRRQKSKEEERKRIAQAAMQAFNKKVRDRVAAAEAKKLAGASFVQRRNSKRQASSEHPLSPRKKAARREPLAQQKKEWQVLVKVGTNAVRLAEAYEDNYGRLEEPEDEHDKENYPPEEAASSSKG